jgi:hypothetical protein
MFICRSEQSMEPFSGPPLQHARVTEQCRCRSSKKNMLHHRFQRARQGPGQPHRRPQPVGSVPPRAALRCAPSWKLAEASLRVATRGWVLAAAQATTVLASDDAAVAAVSRCSRVFQAEERSAAASAEARQCPSYWTRVGHVSVSWARPLEKYKGEQL